MGTGRQSLPRVIQKVPTRTCLPIDTFIRGLPQAMLISRSCEIRRSCLNSLRQRLGAASGFTLASARRETTKTQAPGSVYLSITRPNRAGAGGRCCESDH